jgi:Domain of unknown function (DUF4168)
MQSLLRTTFTFILGFGLIGLGLTSTVRAQEAVPTPKANIGDEELKAFARAYVEVDKIRLAYEPSFRNAQNAQDPQQAQSIQQEATVKMEKAVEEQGLTGETYVKIFNTVKDDPELRGKTIKLIEEEQNKR